MSKPAKPTPPSKTLPAEKIRLELNSGMTLADIIEKTKSIDPQEVVVEWDYDYCCELVWKEGVKTNPKYEEQLAAYEIKLAKYKEKLAEYNSGRKEWLEKELAKLK